MPTSLDHQERMMKHLRKATRFSKASLLTALHIRMEGLQAKHDFDPDNGTAQLGRIPHGERAIDYGRYEMLRDLIAEIE